MIAVSAAMQRIQRMLRTAHMDDDELMALLQTRYETIYETTGWVMRQRELLLSLVGQVSSDETNTVTVTQDSATVLSAGTPFTTAMTGRQIVISGEVTPFFITFFDPAIVSLQDGEGNPVVWPRATDTAASWRIFQSLYTLPAGAGSVEYLGTDIPMREIDGGRRELNRMDPNRQTTDASPLYWCHAGVTTPASVNAQALRQIEVWPVPTTGRIIRGEYEREAPILTVNTVIDIPPPLICYATAADALNALAAHEGGDSGEQLRNLAVFYERKANEVQNDYGPLELARRGVPRTFGKGQQHGLRGDYLVNHQSLTDFS